jgi:hypothetical protein
MAIVRLLLFLSLGTIGVALLLYLFTRDRRYLTFIWTVGKFSLLVLVAVFVYLVADRLVAPGAAPRL